MFVLALCVVWLSCHRVLSQTDKLFTYPETCYPLATRLINETPVAETPPDRRTSGSSPFFFFQKENDCFSKFNQLFRTADGSCNNRLSRGQSFQPFNRVLPPAYSDGVQSPRQFSVLGGRLPSPRTISRVVHPDKKTVTKFTIYLMQWGQLIDHDLASTLLPIVPETDRDDHHSVSREAQNEEQHNECFPILFPPNDPDFRGTCMEFVRSRPVLDFSGPRENENVITSFLDASTVYGSTQEQQDRLRDPKQKYLLNATEDNFPPDNGLDDCVKRNAKDICHLAGDARLNELPGLVLLHTVFLRYHNYVARELVSYNPYSWHEKVFQQARAIVTAVMQNIVFGEWLPITLGPSVRRKFRLDLHPYQRTQHRPWTDPSIFQAFSTAVFRFGHSQIPRSLPLTPSRRVLLRDLFFAPFEARDNLDTLAQGMAEAVDDEDTGQESDRFFVIEITRRLFENEEGPQRAFDLVALNIQRGRDHGLPAYNAYRELLGLARVTSFNDPALGTAGPALASVYNHVDDIDLFSGGMSEPAFDGGVVGETFSHLMGLQMFRFKFGDRFFFDNHRAPYGFTDYQVRQLKRIRFSHVLCLTTGISKVQRDVFRVASDANPEVSCEQLKKEHLQLGYFLQYPF